MQIRKGRCIPPNSHTQLREMPQCRRAKGVMVEAQGSTADSAALALPPNPVKLYLQWMLNFATLKAAFLAEIDSWAEICCNIQDYKV